jgi:hypothetical protein
VSSGWCQRPACENGKCVATNEAAGTACDDGDACTEQTVCNSNGGCSGGGPVDCDGNNGQIAGRGLFSDWASDELCGCETFAWKFDSGGCAPSVCAPADPVTVWFR